MNTAEILNAERETEQHLRERERWVATMLRSISDAVVATDDQGRITYMNPVAETLTGWPQEEALGKNLLEVCPLVDEHAHTLVECPAQTVLRTGQPISLAEHTLLVARDGREIPVEHSAAPIRDDQGQTTGVIMIVRDVSKRRRAEQAQLASERKRAAELDALQATVLDIIVPHDLPTLLETIVEQAARLLNAPVGGLYLSEPERKQVRCVVSYNTSRDYRGIVFPFGMGAAGSVAQSGEPLLIEDYSRWPGRAPAFEQEQPFRALVAVPMTWQDRVIGVIDILHYDPAERFTENDLGLLALFANHAALAVENARLYEQAQHEIAERKRLEQQSEERRLYLERVLDCTPDAIVTTDARHRVLEWNPGAEHLFGYTPAEAVGHDLDELVAVHDPEMLEQATEFTGRILNGMPVSPTETTRYRKDGSPVQITVAGAPILVEGRPIGVAAVYTDITQRKQAEVALRESEDRYRDLVEHSQDLICTHDLKGQMLSVNLVTARRLGYTVEELLQMNVREILAPGAQSKFDEYLDRIQRDGGASGLMQVRTKAGKRRVWHYDNTLRTEGVAEPIVRGTARDITEQVRAEQALRRSEIQYRTTLNSMADAIHVVDRSLHIVLFNEAFKQWNAKLGLRTDALGKKLLEVFPFLPPSVLEEYERVFETGEPLITSEITTVAGQVIITDTRKVPVFEGDRVIQVITVIRDVTKRERAADEIRQLVEFNQSIIQNMAEGIAVEDAEGILTFLNPAAVRLLGYKVEELIGQHWTLLVPSDQQPIIEAADRRRQEGKADRYEVELQHKDGHRVPVLISGSPRFQDDHFDGTLAVFTDISERVQTEAALARHAREMAALYETSLEINSQPDIPTLLQAIVQRAAQLLDAPMGGLYLIRPSSQELELAVGHNLPGHYIGTVLRLGEGLSGRIAQTGEPMMIDDYHAWSGQASAYTDASFRRVLGVPLKSKGRVIGVINITDTERTGPFCDEEVRLVSLFADQAAIAIENARLLEAEARRRREAETLQAATLALSATLDLQQVFESILRELRQVVPYDSASVQRLSGNRLEIIGGHGFPNLEELLGIDFDLDASDNPNQAVVRSRAPLILADAPAVYERFQQAPHAQAGIRAWLGVPLLFGERLIGMIALDKKEPGFYTDEHAQLAQAFAAQAAIAIENARLFQETQQRLNELRLLSDTSTALSTSLDPDRVLRIVTQRIVEALQVEGCTISAWDRERDVLISLIDHVLDSAAWQAEAAGTIHRLADYPATRKVLAERKPHAFRLQDPQTDSAERTWMAGEKIQALLMVPMIVRDSVIGLLELMDGRQDRMFTDTEITLCQTLANQAAAALENARLLQAERVAREQAEKHAADLHDREQFLTLLNDITRAALETPDLSTMVQTLADRLADLLDADGCFLTFWDEGRQLTIPAAAHGPMRDIYPTIRVKPGERTMTKTVLESGQALCEEDFMNSIYAGSPRGIGPSIRSQMALPLIAGDEKLGAMIFSFVRAHHFTPDEITRGEQIARQIALALAKAKLVQSEREQRKLAEVLREAAQVMGTSLELGEILRLLLDQLKRVLVYDTASVLIFRDGDVPNLIAGIGFTDEAMISREASRLLQDSPLLQHMALDLQPVVSGDVRHLEGWIWVPGAEHVRSWMGIPLVAHGRMIGTLMVDHSQVGFFGQTEVQLAQTLAQHAAQAVDNARLYEAEQRRAREAAAVSTVAQALNATTQLDSVFQAIAQELHRLLHFDRLSIALLSDDLQQFHMYALSAEPDAPLALGMVLPTAQTACAADVLAGRPHLTPDLATELEWAGERALYEGGIRSRLNVPLTLGETVIGALNLASTRRNAFSARQVPMLTQVADAVAAAIQNAQLYEETLRRNRELALLNRVIAASAARTTVEPILETVCRELALALDVSRTMATVFHLNKQEAIVVAEYLADAQATSWLHRTFPITDNPVAQYLLEHKTLLVVQNAQTDPRLSDFQDRVPRRENVSFFALPILVHGEVAGSLSVSAAELRTFSEEELTLAQRVAEQVSGALARAQLAESQRRLSAAVEQAAEAIVITDTGGTIVYVNPALEKITGFHRDQSIGFGLYSAEGQDDYAAFCRQLWEKASRTKMWQGRFTSAKADGSYYTVDAALTPVRDEAGEITNYVATLRDVTREVQLEAQIRQAQKMEALGQLAGGIAHDFNNLLTVINLSTQLLRRRLHPQDPLWEHVVRIEETGERATKLTKQLLSFSRREVIEPQVLSLNQIVGDLSRMLKRVIGEDIQLKTSLLGDLWPVKVDPSQMDQVIMNLVINARDAMPQGGTLTIETANVMLDRTYADAHMDAQPGKHVLLSISDTGVGMDDEIRSHLFEPFFTTKDRGQGTGLGLATVFGIIRQSGGHIAVDSEVGHGTTFKIYLPCAEGKIAETPPAPPVRVSGELLAGRETILVVEDKADVRRLAVTVLHSYGYTALEAGDGLEALQVAEQHNGPIHLLLTDVVMPHMNGRALAQELNQRRPDMRVLYMSGYADDAILEQGTLAPGAIFLAKPFSVESLVQKVRAVLDNRL